MTAFQILTLGVAVLAALGIGAIAAAVITAVATSRRERGAWLRQLQVDANRNLYASAQALMTFITTANPDRAGPDQPLGWDAGELAALIADLHHKVLDLAMVGEAETVAMGHTLSEHFPRLAVQALPLPGTRHHAGMEQREDAIRAMSGLLLLVSAVMRNDVGLGGRRYRKELKRIRSAGFYRIQSLSPVDRPETQPDLARLMWEWHVQNFEGHIPKTLDGYRIPMIPVTLPPEVQPQAMAAKPKDGFWQFAVFEGIDTTTRDAIVADALRLITGHRNAFPPKMNPKRVDAEGLESYVWHTLRATEAPAGSGTGGSAPK